MLVRTYTLFGGTVSAVCFGGGNLCWEALRFVITKHNPPVNKTNIINCKLGVLVLVGHHPLLSCIVNNFCPVLIPGLNALFIINQHWSSTSKIWRPWLTMLQASPVSTKILGFTAIFWCFINGVLHDVWECYWIRVMATSKFGYGRPKMGTSRKCRHKRITLELQG